MSVLARLFGALSSFFESKASAKQLAARINALEAERDTLKAQMVQLRTDMAKCKFMVGLNQLTEVTASEV